MITTPTGNFHLPGDTAGRELAALKEWELFMGDLFQKYLHKQSNSIDIGAHIGYHTVRLSKLCRHGKVFAFEPNPILSPIIQKNLIENNCNNVTFYPYALSDNIANGYLTETENTFLVSLASRPTKRRVQIKTIDSLDLPKIDLMKIDTEGFELHILRGAKYLIARDKLALVIEIWDHHIKDYLVYLSSIGYALHHIITDNYVALPRN